MIINLLPKSKGFRLIRAGTTKHPGSFNDIVMVSYALSLGASLKNIEETLGISVEEDYVEFGDGDESGLLQINFGSDFGEKELEEFKKSMQRSAEGNLSSMVIVAPCDLRVEWIPISSIPLLNGADGEFNVCPVTVYTIEQ